VPPQPIAEAALMMQSVAQAGTAEMAREQGCGQSGAGVTIAASPGRYARAPAAARRSPPVIRIVDRIVETNDRVEVNVDDLHRGNQQKK